MRSRPDDLVDFEELAEPSSSFKRFFKRNKRLFALIGAGLLFGLGTAIAAPFVFAAAGIVSSIVAMVILVTCATVLTGLLAAAITMAGFKLYDYFHSESDAAEEQRQNFAMADVIVAMNASVTAATPKVPREGKVFLLDGSEISENRVKSIYGKLQHISSDSMPHLSIVRKICAETSETKKSSMLSAQKRNLSKFIAKDTDEDNEYPIIKSDFTIDPKTCRILLFAIKELPQGGVEIVNPELNPASSAAKPH